MSDQPIRLFEVGPRDGLQNEKIFIPTEDKLKLIHLLQDAGLTTIEATSFVSPKWVPQMADAKDVMAGIKRRKGVSIAALTPNLKGFEAALKAGADEVAIFASASESFSQKNINCSIDESLQRFEPVLRSAKQANIPVRGYVSCIAGCPYEGDVPFENVGRVTAKLDQMGCYEISLGDTIGKGVPDQISALIEYLAQLIPVEKLAGHFHDTGGRAIENISVSSERGIRCFDSSIGGLGGCPYAPGASGNVATEAVVAFFISKGVNLNIDQLALQKAAEFAKQLKQRA